MAWPWQAMGKPKLFEDSTGSNLDLRLDHVNACDLLRDSVLDLNSGVDLNEVVLALLVDKEFISPRILVLGCGKEANGIREQSEAGLRRAKRGSMRISPVDTTGSFFASDSLTLTSSVRPVAGRTR